MDGAGEVSRDEERRRVLEMLGQGKISAAEADELLAALQGDSAAGDVRSSAARQPAARRGASVSGFPALAVVVARVLAKTIGRLSITLGRVVGTMARLFGRVRAESNPHDR